MWARCIRPDWRASTRRRTAAPTSAAGKTRTRAVVPSREPAGDSVGDMTVFTFEVLDRVGGRRIGAGHGYCVRTEVGVANDCLANSSLPGGRIILQWEEHDGQQVSHAAITGGTGRYRGA